MTDRKATHGVTFTSCLLRPKARGSVALRSADPADKPLVDSRFFGHPEDLRLTVASLRFARDLLATSPVAELVDSEMPPGRGAPSDADQQAFCARTVKTNYHPVGTARMGPEGDPLAVLDARLRARGVEGLRVVDCAATPTIPSGNTNAPALAMGSRAATLIMAGQGDGAGAALPRAAAR